MRKAVKVLIGYLFGLLLCSLLLKYLGIEHYVNPLNDSRTQLHNPMMLFTIAGGLIALRLTIAKKQFSVFLIIYTALWLLRFLIIVLADRIGTVQFFGNTYRLDVIIPNYYSSVSRLATPLPFVIFWLINYYFIERGKPVSVSRSTPDKPEDTAG
jgi:hypothetical protein